MTNEEINRYIHEEIMERCWHDVEWNYHTGKCKKESCHQVILFARHGSSGNPDYCSDDSPRRWLNEVVAKLRERSGTPYPYITALDQIVHGEWTLASAEQIARACVEAHKESKK